MALVHRYVDSASDGGNGQSPASAFTSIGSAVSTIKSDYEAMNAGDIYVLNVKVGTHSALTISRSAIPLVDQTYLKPIWIRGYNTTIGDLDYLMYGGANQTINTANLPQCTGAVGTTAASQVDNIICSGIYVLTSSTTVSPAWFGANSIIAGCVIKTTAANSAHNVVELGDGSSLVCCVVDKTSQTTALASNAGVFVNGANVVIVGNDITVGACNGIYINGLGADVTNNVISSTSASAQHGIYINVAGVPIPIISNTIHNFNQTNISAAINANSTSATSNTAIILNNKITDCYYEVLGNTNNGGHGIFRLNNLVARATGSNTGVISEAATSINKITASGGLSSDYVSASGGNFYTPANGSGVNSGVFGGTIGAVQNKTVSLRLPVINT